MLAEEPSARGREPRTGAQEQRMGAQEPRVEAREPRMGAQEQRVEAQEPRMEAGVERHEDPFSSNAVRLSLGEWCGVLAVLICTSLFIGHAWRALHPFDPAPDYRIPYDLSQDYWHFGRFCQTVSGEGRTLVFGDSFVWGQFVEADQTLTHVLNERAESNTFVNAGLDGAHPLAMEGLLRHHCGGLRGEEILLQLNLLWLSSAEADLQAEGSPDFNHPRLVPQLLRAVPSYRASLSRRLGVLVARHLPVFEWGRHLQMAYFENMDLGRWTLEHPYQNPLRPLTVSLPEPSAGEQPLPPRGVEAAAGQRALSGPGRSESGRLEGSGDEPPSTTQQDPPWVDLGHSLQWQAFRRTAEVLRGQGNQVRVLIGPLNEHMLTPSSARTYHEILSGVRLWLESHGYTYHAPATLPSHLYEDLSHPNAEGYAVLGDELWAWIEGSR